MLFSCYLFKEFEVTIEVACKSLHGTTGDIFKEVEITPIQHNLKENLLRCVTTEVVVKICLEQKKT